MRPGANQIAQNGASNQMTSSILSINMNDQAVSFGVITALGEKDVAKLIGITHSK